MLVKLIDGGYQVTLDDGRGLSIPADEGNRHYRMVQEWIAEGNTPEPADIIDPWIEIRAKRDSLLAQSDWTQLSDTLLTAEQKQAWSDYRQALRDLPQAQADPENIIWPVAKAGLLVV